MQKLKQGLFILFIIVCHVSNFYGQGVAINEDGTNAASSAMLDIKSGDKGVLIPRVDIADLSTASPVSSPATGLLVYNNNSSTGTGYYYWSGSEWTQLTTLEDERPPKWNGTSSTASDINRSGNIGIGMTTPNYELDVLGEGLSVSRFRRSTTGGTSGGFQFGNTDQTYEVFGNDSRAALRTDGNYIMYWGTDGRIGIGTTSPTSLLHVDGSVRFSSLGTGTQTTGLMIDGSGNLSARTLNIANWDNAYSWGDHATEGYLHTEVDPTWSGTANQTGDIGRSGNVGIGTTSPQTQLHITEDMQIGTDGVNRNNLMTFWAENGYEANIVMRETPDHGMGIRYNANDNNLYFDRYPNATTPAPIMTIMRDSENIGIGTTTPQSMLHVDGSVRFSSLGTGTQTTGLMIDGSGNLSARTLNIANWDNAYSWGDHAAEGYLLTEVDPTWSGTANETGDIGRSGNVGIGTT
ncbi:MAG: hypothetical protein R6V52_11590, partial [Bacteroidales bacterium]